jgi:hypothetical protein
MATANNTASNIFSISNFKTAIGKPVRPNLFRAILRGWDDNAYLKQFMAAELINDINDFSFRCEKAELPGRSIATSDDTGSGGPALKLPYDVTYNDMQLSIICSADMKERVFFESWIDSIVRPADYYGGTVGYFEDYARGVTLEVQQLDESGAVLISYILQDVYPTVISPMNATWEEVNSYQRFGVTLFYRYHKYTLGEWLFTS